MLTSVDHQFPKSWDLKEKRYYNVATRITTVYCDYCYYLSCLCDYYFFNLSMYSLNLTNVVFHQVFNCYEGEMGSTLTKSIRNDRRNGSTKNKWWWPINQPQASEEIQHMGYSQIINLQILSYVKKFKRIDKLNKWKQDLSFVSVYLQPKEKGNKAFG